jgi:uncharacterized protein with NRDE domain
MCLITIAHQQHESYPLLVAANRDEYYQRPTAAAQVWPGTASLLAGKDLQAGGTWLGVTRTGRFAAITNHRNPPTTPRQPRSRGLLTLDFLRGTMKPADYLQTLATDASEYAGFNLLLGDGEELFYFSNIEATARRLAPGIYGVSNALLDTPWPKLSKARQRLQNLLQGPRLEDPEKRHDHLAAVVSDRAVEPDEKLPNTGVELELERLLSAQFICSEEYGTRATTSIFRRDTGAISFCERNFSTGGVEAGRRCFELSPDGRE